MEGEMQEHLGLLAALIVELNEIGGNENERATGADSEQEQMHADAILLDYLDAIGRDDLTSAYRKARERVGFWYITERASERKSCALAQ